MTIIQDHLPHVRGGSSLLHQLAALPARLHDALQRARRNEQAEAELRAYSDRELREIGLARRDIPRAVRGELDHPLCRPRI